VLWLTNAAAIVIPTGLMVRHGLRHGLAGLAYSHFWYMTLIWLVCFPLRSIGFVTEIAKPHAGETPAVEHLTLALLITLTLWMAMWIGYVRTPRSKYIARGDDVSPLWPTIAVATICALSLAFVSLTYETLRPITSGQYFSDRVGNGHLFIAPEIFVYATVIGLGLSLSTSGPRTSSFVLAWAALIVISFGLTSLTGSRRMFATVLIAGTVILTLRKPAFLPVLPVLLLGSILGAPLSQIWRLNFLSTAPADYWNSLLNYLHLRPFLLFIVNTYEGIEHVANFIKTAGTKGLMWGIDHGMSWIYNIGLALVPRALWSTKPLHYGNVAQQQLLYPETFQGGLPTETLPPSYIVDFLYGFGVFVAAGLAVSLGWILKKLENTMTDHHSALPIRILSVFVLTQMFAVVRSGTGFGQTLLIFCVVLTLVFSGPLIEKAKGGQPSS
jgi:hypothetical protein